MQAPVSFEYKDDTGNRTGNPHAVFVLRRKDGTESTKVHIEQTAGVSNSGKPFPRENSGVQVKSALVKYPSAI